MPDRLVDEAVAVAEGLAAVPFEAFHLTKRLLREPALRRMREGARDRRDRPGGLGGRHGPDAVREYVARTLKR